MQSVFCWGDICVGVCAPRNAIYLFQRDLLRRLIVAEQLAETGPADERVEHALVILVRHARDDGLEDEIAVDGLIGLLVENVVNVAEQAERQQALAPEGLALVGNGGELLAA